MNNETHPDLFGGETPIVEDSEREQGSGECPDCGDPYCEAAGCQNPCVICGGEGTVRGQDHFDPMWDYEKYNNPFATCPSCGGSGLAKDMSYC